MVAFVTILLFSGIFPLIEGNVTIIKRDNVFLSRKKRYLQFPMGSNFVITFSGIKAIQQVQPMAWMILGEMDVPFALPSDTSIFRKLPHERPKRHSIERRQVYTQFAAALSQWGYNGEACVNRMICDVKKYAPLKGKSLIKDILLAVFTSSNDDFKNACDNSELCETSFLDYILNGFILPVD